MVTVRDTAGEQKHKEEDRKTEEEEEEAFGDVDK